MPGQNNPVNSTQLATLASRVASANTDAIDALEDYENAPPPQDKTDVCADLQALKEELQNEIAAINATMADLGCGQ